MSMIRKRVYWESMPEVQVCFHRYGNFPGALFTGSAEILSQNWLLKKESLWPGIWKETG